MEEQIDQPSRTYIFRESGELQQFLQHYKMSIEKCLKTMAMDPECQHKCSEKVIHEFGGSKCKARCEKNAIRALSQTERQVILYSMIYVVQDNANLHPDVREHLWLRASGATQFMKTYVGYASGGQGSAITKDYYTALEDSPKARRGQVGISM